MQDGHTVVMGAVATDTDTQRLTPNADADDEQESETAGVVDKLPTNSRSAHDGPASTTTRRCRFASVLLFVLLLMLSGGFCVWTMIRLSRIEARLERLEVIGRPSVVDFVVEPRHSTNLFTRRRPVCTIVIFVCMPYE